MLQSQPHFEENAGEVDGEGLSQDDRARKLSIKTFYTRSTIPWTLLCELN